MERMGRKRSCFLSLVLAAAVILSGCGSDESESGSASKRGFMKFDAEQEMSNDIQSDGEIAKSAGSKKGQSTDVESETEEIAEEGMESGTSTAGDSERGVDEKLIYHSTILMETVDFDKTIRSFQASIESLGGFIEYENYSNQVDFDYLSKNTYRDYEKFNSATDDRSYRATVRIPSGKYNQFLTNTEKIGNVTGKESNVTNVTTEYQDLQTQLEIYEAKQKRLVQQLEKASDKLALQIEEKLTDIQIKIAQLHNRVDSIDTDVNYSTVEITINEVSEYQEEPRSDDTFFDRLKNTVIDSAESFLFVLEMLLLLLIRLLPYLVILVIIVALWARRRKKKADRTDRVEDVEIDLRQETASETDVEQENEAEETETKN